MGLVRMISFPYLFTKQFKGCILVCEYSYFLLQKNQDIRNTLDLAVKKYKSSGTQATVLNALQAAIKAHGNDHDMLMQKIIEIIQNNCMCKWLFSKAHEVSNDVHQQRNFFNHT